MSEPARGDSRSRNGLAPVVSFGYGARMRDLRYRACRSETRWLRRLAKLFLLVVGLSTGLNVAAAAGQGAHCARHGVSQLHVVQPGGGHQESHHGPMLAWERPAHADCPHCPATECARIAPCATSTNGAIPPSPIELGAPLAHAVAVPPVLAALHSTLHQPPTPPPQSVS